MYINEVRSNIETVAHSTALNNISAMTIELTSVTSRYSCILPCSMFQASENRRKQRSSAKHTIRAERPHAELTASVPSLVLTVFADL